MYRLCVIPARGGSKRLPGKHTMLINGKPLIHYTLDAVYRCSGYFDTILMCTNSIETHNCVIQHEIHSCNNFKMYGRQIQGFTEDTDKVIDYIRWLFDTYDEYLYDHEKTHGQLWYMLPTCPFRQSYHIRAAINHLTNHDYDSVISVTEFEFPPHLRLFNDNGYLKEDNISLPFAHDDTRSQDARKVYRPNGGLYGTKWESFRKYRNFFKGDACPLFMNRKESVDIDTYDDLQYAEYLIKNDNNFNHLSQ